MYDERDNWGHDPERAEDEPEFEPVPDPDDDPARRSTVAARDARILTLISVGVSIFLVFVCSVLGLIGVDFMRTFTPGLAVGCGVATVNLHILSRMVWGMFEQRVGPALLGFLLSFATLIGTALFLAARRPDWLLGFGVGLALPGVAGVLFAVWANRGK